jgi:hypothetical protein
MYKENLDYKNRKWYSVQTLLNGNKLLAFYSSCCGYDLICWQSSFTVSCV